MTPKSRLQKTFDVPRLVGSYDGTSDDLPRFVGAPMTVSSTAGAAGDSLLLDSRPASDLIGGDSFLFDDDRLGPANDTVLGGPGDDDGSAGNGDVFSGNDTSGDTSGDTPRYEYDEDGNLTRTSEDQFQFVNISAPVDDGSLPSTGLIVPGGPFGDDDDDDAGGFNPPPLRLDDPEPESDFDQLDTGIITDGDAIL